MPILSIRQHNRIRRAFSNIRFKYGKRFLITLIFVAGSFLVVYYIYGVCGVWSQCSGFQGKTIWDWMELLIIPVVLASAAIWFNWQESKTNREIAEKQRETDRKIATDQQYEKVLVEYFDRMSHIILDKNLRKSKKNDDVRELARAITLTTLRRLDGKRKGILLRFLYESDLIGTKSLAPLIDLHGADFGQVVLAGDFRHDDIKSYASLSGANFSGAFFGEAYLPKVDLSNANFTGAILTKAHLADSILRNANLSDTYLNSAFMVAVDLAGAKLCRSIMVGTNLCYASLVDADLKDALMASAELSGAYIDDEQLHQAKDITNIVI